MNKMILYFKKLLVYEWTRGIKEEEEEEVNERGGKIDCSAVSCILIISSLAAKAPFQPTNLTTASSYYRLYYE